MLAITSTAAEVIDQIVTSSEMPEGAGLRITSEATQDNDGNPRTDLRLTLTERPVEGDQVLEETPVFVEEETAEMLDDKVLDASVQEDQIQFSLKQQADEI